MRDILVLTDADGGTAVLTTASPLSHYGCPVLRITADDVDGDFGPADMLGDLDHPETLVSAAGVVAGWATMPGRTAEELDAARRFLAQWPDGPQVTQDA